MNDLDDIAEQYQDFVCRLKSNDKEEEKKVPYHKRVYDIMKTYLMDKSFLRGNWESGDMEKTETWKFVDNNHLNSYFKIFVKFSNDESKATIGIERNVKIYEFPAGKAEVPVCNFWTDDDDEPINDDDNKRIKDIVDLFVTKMKSQNDLVKKTLMNMDKKFLIEWEFECGK